MEACWSVLYGWGRAEQGNSRYREYNESRWILGKHGVRRVQHWLPWSFHRWGFHISCDSTGGVACHEGHILQTSSLHTCTKNRHAARDHVGHNSVPNSLCNLQAMPLKRDRNTWCCHLHRACCNTRSWHWDFVDTWEATLPTAVLRSTPLRFICDCSSTLFWGIVGFLIGISRRATIMTTCV
jgi:hypothetical protein